MSGETVALSVLIGLLADPHHHLDNIRLAVARFRERSCDLVVFAGDLVSSIAVPPLRGLPCPAVGCFGDNEGNRPGVAAGFSLMGVIGEGPLGIRVEGRRLLVTHMLRQIGNDDFPYDAIIYAHTHKARVHRDELGRLLVNPGELGGWVTGRATVGYYDTETGAASLEVLVDRNGIREPPEVIANSLG
mgnify:CR=1 FL=1